MSEENKKQADEIGRVLALDSKLGLLSEQGSMRIMSLGQVAVAVLDKRLGHVKVSGLGLLDGANVVGLAATSSGDDLEQCELELLSHGALLLSSLRANSLPI